MGFLLGWVALALIAVLMVARNASMRKPALYLLPVAMLGFVAVIFTYGQDLWLRLENSDMDLQQRLFLYAQVVPLILERPFFGFGGGTFAQAFPAVHGADLRPDLLWDKAHNTYLTLWSELGIVFGSIPMLLIAALGVTLSASLARAAGSWTAQAAALVVIFVAALHSLVDFSLEIEAVAFLFVVISAIGLAGSKVRTLGQ